MTQKSVLIRSFNHCDSSAFNRFFTCGQWAGEMVIRERTRFSSSGISTGVSMLNISTVAGTLISEFPCHKVSLLYLSFLVRLQMWSSNAPSSINNSFRQSWGLMPSHTCAVLLPWPSGLPNATNASQFSYLLPAATLSSLTAGASVPSTERIRNSSIDASSAHPNGLLLHKIDRSYLYSCFSLSYTAYHEKY